jgi:hypothetical protein
MVKKLWILLVIVMLAIPFVTSAAPASQGGRPRQQQSQLPASAR